VGGSEGVLRVTFGFIAGMIDIGFAIFHAMFWKLLGWPERLEPSGSINAAITQTLNAVLIYVFVIYGSVLIGFAMADRLAPNALTAAGAGFWALRAALQPLQFSMRTKPSIVLMAAFIIAAIVHGLAVEA
jgi:hypothetical protein